MPIHDALQVASEMAEALEKAHEKGIIHRDLKPANIMLDGRRRFRPDQHVVNIRLRLASGEWIAAKNSLIWSAALA